MNKEQIIKRIWRIMKNDLKSVDRDKNETKIKIKMFLMLPSLILVQLVFLLQAC